MDSITGKIMSEKELDIRTEMDEFFSGEDFSEKKGVIFIHRKIRRDLVTNQRELCSCNKSYTGSGEKNCPYCKGVGFLWDEKIIESYLYNKRYISFTNSHTYTRALGRDFNEQYIFLTKYKYKIEEGDSLLELKKTDNGRIAIPLNIDIEFLITANRYMGAVKNLGEYTLAVGEIRVKGDHVEDRSR